MVLVRTRLGLDWSWVPSNNVTIGIGEAAEDPETLPAMKPANIKEMTILVDRGHSPIKKLLFVGIVASGAYVLVLLVKLFLEKGG